MPPANSRPFVLGKGMYIFLGASDIMPNSPNVWKAKHVNEYWVHIASCKNVQKKDVTEKILS
jgi:hypothetical protein